MSNNQEQQKDDIYIDCSPTGESAENIATYNVPINSEYTRDAKKLDLMRTLLNLCVALIFLIIVYFTLPRMYKYGVIDPVNREFPDYADMAEKVKKCTNVELSDLVFAKDDKPPPPIKQRIARIYTADVYITTFFVLFLVHFIYAAKDGDFMSIYYAILLSGIYAMGVLIVNGLKKDEAVQMRTQTAEGVVFTRFPLEEWKKNDDGTAKQIAFDFTALSWLFTFDFANFFSDVALYASGMVKRYNTTLRKGVTFPLQTPVPFILVAMLTVYFLVILVLTYGQPILSIFSLELSDKAIGSWTTTRVIYPILISISILMFCLGFNIGTQDSIKKKEQKK